MKKAYVYIRISDEDQSNFSVSGQQRIIEFYTNKHNIEVVKTFTDDGVSAKNFNRPAWKALEQELYKNRNTIDFLLIMKYDRLIRYTLEGLMFIEKLEKQWGVRLVSVMEDYALNPADPEFVGNRLQKLVDAEKERHRSADRIRMGIWSAKIQGRFIGTAPLGYDNQRDAADRPIIVVNPEESKVVQEIFNDFINDVPFTLLMAKLKKAGYELKGHSSLHRMLSNHTYAGLINVRGYKDHQGYVGKANHQAIIPEDTFWLAYYKLKDAVRPQFKNIVDDNVPLRGYILCQKCGMPHTGGKSKGRNAFYYYYRCKCSRGENFSAKITHDEMREILGGLSLKPQFTNDLKIILEEELEIELKTMSSLLPSLRKKKAIAESNLASLEEKYIRNKINQDSYDKWFPKLKQEVLTLNAQITEADKDNGQVMDLINTNIQYLGDLNYIYTKSSIPEKHDILSEIFIGGFTKENIGGRTGMLNDLFLENALLIGHLLRVEKRKTDKTADLSRRCRRGESSRTALETFLSKISKIISKAA